MDNTLTIESSDRVIGILFPGGMGKEELYSGSKGQPFLKIELVCGGSVVYQTFEDVPAVNVPCSCGNPSHWFLKYEEG